MVLVLAGLCVVAVALVPTILSTDAFRNSLLAAANRRLGGTVVLGELSLSLTGALRLAGLTLWPGEPGAGEPLLDVPRVEFEKDVLPVLLGRLVLRGRVDGFRARLVVHADGRTNVEDFLGLAPCAGGGPGAHGPGAHEPGAPRLPGRPGGPPRRMVQDLRALWPATRCDVVLEDGSALLVDERLGTTSGVEDLSISLRSERYADPLELRVRASVLVDDARSPFELVARAFGDMEPRWELEVRAEGMPPGSLLGPLLAAACPLLAGDGSGAPVTVRAPIDLSLSLSGEDIDALLQDREPAGLAGRIELRLGPGDANGAVLGRARAALDALAARGVALAPPSARAGGAAGDAADAARTTPRLALQGFSAALVVRDDRVEIEHAVLLDAAGVARPLAVEGHADLDGRLHYRIAWPSLVPDAPALHGRALTIEGPWRAPRVENGLEDLLSAAHGPRAATVASGAGAPGR